MPLRRLLVRGVARWPWLYLTVWSWRANRQVARLERRWQCDRVARAVIDRIGGARCVAGPFEGLQLPPSIWRRHISPKLLGTYESELHAVIAACRTRRPSRVINIGAGDGYFAVGLARLLGVPTVAFEADPAERRWVRQMSILNRTPVEVRGPATVDALRRSLQPGSLVFCDCEGGEDRLLDPTEIPLLAGSDIIVELHEGAAPGVGDRLRRRFRSTHDITTIDAVLEKTPPAVIADLPPADRARAVREHRSGGQCWLWLAVRTSGPTRT